MNENPEVTYLFTLLFEGSLIRGIFFSTYLLFILCLFSWCPPFGGPLRDFIRMVGPQCLAYKVKTLKYRKNPTANKPIIPKVVC